MIKTNVKISSTHCPHDSFFSSRRSFLLHEHQHAQEWYSFPFSVMLGIHWETLNRQNSYLHLNIFQRKQYSKQVENVTVLYSILQTSFKQSLKWSIMLIYWQSFECDSAQCIPICLVNIQLHVPVGIRLIPVTNFWFHQKAHLPPRCELLN